MKFKVNIYLRSADVLYKGNILDCFEIKNRIEVRFFKRLQ